MRTSIEGLEIKIKITGDINKANEEIAKRELY